MPQLGRRAIAEFIGTFWLVFGGTGSAIFAAVFLSGTNVQLGIGFVGVALAFGLTVLTMAFALGHISGAHFNPAVTIGLWAGKRFPAREIAPYAIAQVAGAVVASGLLYAIVGGHAGFSLEPNGLAANGYGDHSPGGYGLVAALVVEAVLTFGFLIVILTHRNRPRANVDSSRQHPGYEHVGKPGAFDRPRSVHGRMGARPGLALHRSADPGSADRGIRISSSGRRTGYRRRRSQVTAAIVSAR